MNILQLFDKIFGLRKTSTPEVLNMIKDGSQLAVDEGKRHNFKLDYSVDSIKMIDQILNRIRKENLPVENPRLLESFSVIFGLYIIAVIERNYEEGYLQKRLPGLETDALPYYYRGNLIFPYLWCLNKLSDKNGQDIWPLFKNVTSK